MIPRPTKTLTKWLSVAMVAMPAATLQAQQDHSGSGSAEDNWSSWSEMRSERLSASELLNGDVTNGLNPVGSVLDLLLADDHQSVQYILYETPYPYNLYGADNGFTTFESAEFEYGFDPNDVEVRLEVVESEQLPEELEVTRAEANDRLVSRLIDEDLYFPDGEFRRIDDMLIDPRSGEITHYVIEMNSDSFFDDDQRAIPASDISISERGILETSVALDDVTGMEKFQMGMR